MEFLEAAAAQGFVAAEERPSRAAQALTARPNRFLTYWLYLYEDGSALLTWEFAVADYLSEKGIQLASAESLNLFMFPSEDDRGPQEAAWLIHALEQAEARLRSVDFADPGSR